MANFGIETITDMIMFEILNDIDITDLPVSADELVPHITTALAIDVNSDPSIISNPNMRGEIHELYKGRSSKFPEVNKVLRAVLS
jgi:hypothetical protein